MDNFRRAVLIAEAVGGGRLRSVGFKVKPGGKTGRALVAETALQRARGLRGSDLGVHDAMVLAGPEDTAQALTMHGVRADLDVAWLDEFGQHLGHQTMAAGEQVVQPPAVYRHAMEMRAGDAAKFGITDGSRVTFDDGAGNPAIGLPAADTVGPARVEPVQRAGTTGD